MHRRPSWQLGPIFESASIYSLVLILTRSTNLTTSQGPRVLPSHHRRSGAEKRCLSLGDCSPLRYSRLGVVNHPPVVASRGGGFLGHSFRAFHPPHSFHAIPCYPSPFNANSVRSISIKSDPLPCIPFTPSPKPQSPAAPTQLRRPHGRA